MAKVIAVANQKGGVGKTTSAINLAAALAISGQRCLLIDMDPQCNATSGIGHDPISHHPLLSSDNPMDQLLPCMQWDEIFQTQPKTDSATERRLAPLSLLPGSRTFHDVDQLAHLDGPDARRVRETIERLMPNFDYVLIDCPPSVGNLTQSAMSASDEVLIPIQCEYFAMEGLTSLIQLIRRVIEDTDGRLNFGGILLTMYDPRLELTGEVDAEVRDFFGEIVFNTVIPRDVALCEAPSYGQSIFQYAPRSRGAFAYTQLCMEVLGHE
ncbi:MAG: ParA family protein [Planctomycetota bacterium]